MKIATFNEDRPRLLIVGHERSGNHFLMNMVAHAFGYVSKPWIDVDYGSANFNYYHPPSVAGFFQKLKAHRLANTIKSHHQVDFLAQCLSEIVESFIILYVYRNPMDVMRSCQKLMLNWDWVEGPRVGSCKEYIRAPPCGYMMRYQMRQHPNMLERWQAHVDGWMKASDVNPNIIPIRYEELDEGYERMVGKLAAALNLQARPHERPSRHKNVIPLDASPRIDCDSDEFDDDDLEFIREHIGPTMRRLGYL
jgi:hypothetical protein